VKLWQPLLVIVTLAAIAGAAVTHKNAATAKATGVSAKLVLDMSRFLERVRGKGSSTWALPAQTSGRTVDSPKSLFYEECIKLYLREEVSASAGRPCRQTEDLARQAVRHAWSIRQNSRHTQGKRRPERNAELPRIRAHQKNGLARKPTRFRTTLARPDLMRLRRA
jgi:hypothetical protein